MAQTGREWDSRQGNGVRAEFSVSLGDRGGTVTDTWRLKHQEFPGLSAQIYERPHLFPVRPFSRRICHATLLELALVDNYSLNTFAIRH